MMVSVALTPTPTTSTRDDLFLAASFNLLEAELVHLTLSNLGRLSSANSAAASFIICAARVAVIKIFVSRARWSARRHLMPLHESDAIVLQSYALGEADRIVSFLSRNMGRVRGVAAGARRTKSRFGSTLERL